MVVPPRTFYLYIRKSRYCEYMAGRFSFASEASWYAGMFFKGEPYEIRRYV